MKKATKFFALVIVMVAFAVNSYGQVSATATASATIITPITITKSTDMNFGNVAVNATAGTVVMATDNSRSVTGGCTLPATAGTVAAAAFDISGVASATYSITLPSSATTITSGANTMTVDTWTSNPTPTGTLDGTGASTLLVGATLHVAGSQAAGTYTSATPFTVTVNYN
ncbi:MAG TPA: DUF4402 domain-containing protein [Bacteroidales bacterium]|nr:DUF4402 domain-containing protein [Bacteroidales bacterium]